MPRSKKSKLTYQSFPIRRFSGIETKIKPTDQKPGTLRLADGVNTIPVGALTFGPNWQPAWNQTAFITAVETALAGADPTKSHFVTVAGTGTGATFLVAWDLANHRARGVFHVIGNNDPFTNFTNPGVTITAPNNTTYRGYTAGLNFYPSQINGDQIWIGNGTDQNLVWKSGALAILGALIPADSDDISQVQWPACKSFVQTNEGMIIGGGNAALPLRLWSSEAPTISYPKPEGLKTSSYSWKDLQVDGTAVTALSIHGGRPVAHLNNGSPVMLVSIDGSRGGWKFDQLEMQTNAGAINPACTRDTKISPMYLGTDLEIYRPKQSVGSDVDRWRAVDIVTELASSRWNKAATKPFSGDDYAILYDEKNGRIWSLIQMSAGARQGLYCYDERSVGITGPWRYPDLVAVCQTRDQNDGTVVCGVTRDGVWLWADLGLAGTMTPDPYATPLPADCAVFATPPTSDPGIPYVGVDSVNSKFIQVLNGQTIRWASPWDDPDTTTVVTPDSYFKNARLGLIELSAEDWGIPDVLKEMSQIRIMLRRNSCLYAGVYMEVSGQRYGQWMPAALYPDENWVANARGLGGKLIIRLVFVSFNAHAAYVSSITPEWQLSSPK